MTKRILVLWAKTSATNLGIRILASGSARLCEMAFGDVEVDYHDHDTPGTPLGKNAIAKDIGRRHGQVKELFRSYDLIVDTTSGDSFTDIYGARRLTVMTYAHRAAFRSGVPLVLAPQTIGPFESKYGRRIGRASVVNATRLYARDSASARYASGLGRKPDVTSADLVFALPVLPPRPSRSGIYLNVSGLLWRPNPHVDNLLYRRQIADTVKSISSAGLKVTLFPHVLRASGSREDDVTAVEEAWRELESLTSNIDMFVPSSLDDVRSHLHGAAAVVGARMHASLNSLSVGTPTMAWAYSRKFAPLLSDIGWDAHLDLRTTENVAETTMKFIDELDRWTEKVPHVQQTAARSLRSVAHDLATVL